MKFTTEEISLCKQIAKKHTKETEYGDWFILDPDPHYFPTVFYFKEHKMLKDALIPLWTISDCLEFLRAKGWTVIHLSEAKSGWYTKIITYDKSVKPYVHWGDGKTPLETCLKAVLGVLEDKK